MFKIDSEEQSNQKTNMVQIIHVHATTDKVGYYNIITNRHALQIGTKNTCRKYIVSAEL